MILSSWCYGLKETILGLKRVLIVEKITLLKREVKIDLIDNI